ncbi:alcohol oxidase [Cantharellus anzutake]|uniref:alcohol oxidase n=1 Tax=Cantharellus anzutake TaxID=1750568 RepID=UPI001905FC7C|nr:alcohol oxidase [Cantharellus anzutake]KAF8326563.1 alcohol oxidase [Cantharellus anzutake]
MAQEPVFATPEAFSHAEYDYLVVGGGTAGLVVASRLSEDPTVTVGVIEAGGYFPDEPLINVPGMPARVSYELIERSWLFLTVPQENVLGRPIFHPRGKLLGGTSALNFMATVSVEEYDAFETIGNEGWNWESFLKYMKKSETVAPSDPEFGDKYNAKLEEGVHGDSGPLKLSHSTWTSGLTEPLFKSLEALGIKPNPDSSNGDNTGSYSILGSIDPVTKTRSYSAPAYFAPNASRTNLSVLLNAQATRVILEKRDGSDEYEAKGVEFVSAIGGEENKVKLIAKAKKEVVLSAGTFMTPQLLELSGIGDRAILEKFGIPLRIELPGVGDNLQDHIYTTSTIEVSNELETLDVLRDEERSLKEIDAYERQEGLLASTHSAFAFLPVRAFAPAEDVERMKTSIRDAKESAKQSGQKRRLELLEKWFDDEKHPQLEVITYPGFFPAPGKTPKSGSHYNAVLVALMHPLSFGTVHISSSDPLSKPVVDPKYLSNNVDLEILAHGVRFTRKLHSEEPLKSLTKAFVEPAWDEELDDNEVKTHVKSVLEPVYHPAGTAAMLPQEDGGVVNSRLKVYGTSNLRIVDASIFPFHISAHPQTTIYGMAEKVLCFTLKS